MQQTHSIHILNIRHKAHRFDFRSSTLCNTLTIKFFNKDFRYSCIQQKEGNKQLLQRIRDVCEIHIDLSFHHLRQIMFTQFFYMMLSRKHNFLLLPYVLR